ncbi:MAG: VPLPA-CTERM sorting domain-containing protein [Aliishimia sp.]
MRRFTFVAALSAVFCGPVHAAIFNISDADTTANSPTFNTIRSFSITLDVADVLVAGQSYGMPTINDLSYSVFGILTDPTPSGFPAFDLRRANITNSEFYAQGSQFEFGISATANLLDGLQISELSFFTLNAREVGTGRYHPFSLGITSDGNGTLQNSNNSGGINPGSGNVVDVDFGEEYIADLVFDPATTLVAAPATAAVPLPASLPMLLAGLGGLVAFRRRAQK